MEDVLKPEPVFRAVVRIRLHADPHPLRARAGQAILRRAKRAETVVARPPRLVEMPCGEKPLHGVHLVEREDARRPMRRRYPRRNRPFRRTALELVFRHAAHPHDLRVRHVHLRHGIILVPRRRVFRRDVRIRSHVRLTEGDERHERAVLLRVANRDAPLVRAEAERRIVERASIRQRSPLAVETLAVVNDVVQPGVNSRHIRAGKGLPHDNRILVRRDERLRHARDVPEHVRRYRPRNKRIKRLAPAVWCAAALSVHGNLERETAEVERLHLYSVRRLKTLPAEALADKEDSSGDVVLALARRVR